MSREQNIAKKETELQYYHSVVDTMTKSTTELQEKSKKNEEELKKTKTRYKDGRKEMKAKRLKLRKMDESLKKELVEANDLFGKTMEDFTKFKEKKGKTSKVKGK
jgi:septation ring formation regulator EzrA